MWCDLFLLCQGPGTCADATDGAGLHKRRRVSELHGTGMHVDLDAISSAWSPRKPAVTSQQDGTRQFSAASLKVWSITKHPLHYYNHLKRWSSPERGLLQNRKIARMMPKTLRHLSLRASSGRVILHAWRSLVSSILASSSPGLAKRSSLWTSMLQTRSTTSRDFSRSHA